jgi:hypothetical protein
LKVFDNLFKDRRKGGMQSRAMTQKHRFLLDLSERRLMYDADGNRGEQAVTIAYCNGATVVLADDGQQYLRECGRSALMNIEAVNGFTSFTVDLEA